MSQTQASTQAGAAAPPSQPVAQSSTGASLHDKAPEANRRVEVDDWPFESDDSSMPGTFHSRLIASAVKRPTSRNAGFFLVCGESAEKFGV